MAKTRQLRVTVRMGWEETTEVSAAQLKEEIQNMLDKYVPPNGKLDIDVRNIGDK